MWSLSSTYADSHLSCGTRHKAPHIAVDIDQPCLRAAADNGGMDKTRQSELRERIAHYRGLRRMTLDERALKALDHLITEAEVQLRPIGRRDEGGPQP